MKFTDRHTVELLRMRFPKGARVELVHMNDPYVTIPAGTQGTVTAVDDTGTVFVSWDTGHTLGAVYGVDTIKEL